MEPCLHHKLHESKELSKVPQESEENTSRLLHIFRRETSSRDVLEKVYGKLDEMQEQSDPAPGGSRLSLLTIIILSHLLLTDKFPVANPIKHGRNYFVRRLHYAAEEVRSYTLYFPLHRKGNFRCLANSGLKAT